MDGTYMSNDKTQKTVAFLTPEQAELYGGYAAAQKTLKVDLLRPPIFLDEHWQDLDPLVYPEVGHA